MIMDPRDLRNVHGPDASSPSSGQNFSPGSVPPGVLFDPFGPSPDTSSKPKPDHFKPPLIKSSHIISYG